MYQFLWRVIIFYLTGGCGRNGMKDSVKFFIPPGSSRKIVDPPSLFVKVSCNSPLSNHHHQKFSWVYSDVVPTCKGHHCPCQLGVWGSGGAVRSPGQNLRGGPGVGAHRSSQNPGVSRSKSGLQWESRTITLVIVGKIYQTRKDLMFFFNTIVACKINRTLRKHNTNEVKDSVIFLQTNISWLYHSSSGL